MSDADTSPPPAKKPKKKPRGKAFAAGPDPRRLPKGTTLARARERLPVPVPDWGDGATFAQACDVLAHSHVLPGILASLETKIGSPPWRWAAETVLRYSQRVPGPDKLGKGPRLALPADVQRATALALRDPGVRAWIAEQPDVVAGLQALAAETETPEELVEVELDAPPEEPPSPPTQNPPPEGAGG